MGGHIIAISGPTKVCFARRRRRRRNIRKRKQTHTTEKTEEEEERTQKSFFFLHARVFVCCVCISKSGPKVGGGGEGGGTITPSKGGNRREKSKSKRSTIKKRRRVFSRFCVAHTWKERNFFDLWRARPVLLQNKKENRPDKHDRCSTFRKSPVDQVCHFIYLFTCKSREKLLFYFPAEFDIFDKFLYNNILHTWEGYTQ